MEWMWLQDCPWEARSDGGWLCVSVCLQYVCERVTEHAYIITPNSSANNTFMNAPRKNTYTTPRIQTQYFLTYSIRNQIYTTQLQQNIFHNPHTKIYYTYDPFTRLVSSNPRIKCLKYAK